MYKLHTNSQYTGRDFYNFGTTSSLPRHRWYYLKEGFSANFAEEAISVKLNGQNRKLNILDPFGGTGTSALTSALLGHQFTAIEVNPFLAFTAQVKTIVEKWDRECFENKLIEIIDLSSNGAYSELEGFSTFTQNKSLTKWLFNKSVIRQFTSVVNSIEEVGDIYCNAFKLAALVAVFKCCNAKRDGKALRYKKNWKDLGYSDRDFIREFRVHASMMLRDILDYPIKSENKPRILTGDSRKLLSDLEANSYDLVITSPPYLNSFDYSDVYRPELFLGNFVSNNKELTNIRLKTIRSHVQVDWPQQTSVKSGLLEPILKKLNQAENLWSKKIPLMVEAYFDDLNKVIQDTTKNLRQGGQVWMVVGTSAYGGVHIPVDLIIAELANDSGLTFEGIHRLRDLRASGQQWKRFNTKRSPLRESLIILTKTW